MQLTKVNLIFLTFIITKINCDDIEDFDQVFHFSSQHPLYSRIIGGKRSSLDDWSFMAAMNVFNQEFVKFCSGTLIHKYWILTAGHCILDNVKVVNGTIGRMRLRNQEGHIFKALLAVRHPNYKYEFGIFHNDLAMIKLVKPIYATDLQIPKFSDEPLTSKTFCRTVAWGVENSKRSDRSIELYEIKQETISLTQCRNVMGDEVILESNICTKFSKKGINPCLGESGSPLICGSRIHGVVSYSIGCASAYPVIWTRLEYFQEWISETIRQHTKGARYVRKVDYGDDDEFISEFFYIPEKPKPHSFVINRTESQTESITSSRRSKSKTNQLISADVYTGRYLSLRGGLDYGNILTGNIVLLVLCIFE